MAVDAYACILWQAELVAGSDPAAGGWSPGPLPIPLTLAPRWPQQGAAVVTDREARSTHFAARVHSHLYGHESRSSVVSRRCHRMVADDAVNIDGSLVEAWEVLVGPDGDCTAVAHVQLGQDPVRALASLTMPGRPGFDHLATTLPAPVGLLGTRPQVVSHLRWTGAELPDPALPPFADQALATWPAFRRWQWFLATGLSPETVLPDIEGPDVLAGTVWLSRDWRALVLRDGIGFVALTPSESSAAASGGFHESAREYVRSIYVDVLLLGRMQVAAAHRFADAVSDVHVDTISAESLATLEGELIGLRTGIWWEHITRRGGQVNDVLAAFHRQHRLPELYAKIVADLEDVGRFVRMKQAAAEQAAHEAAEHARRAGEQQQAELAQSITLVSFVLFPLSLVFGGLALWADPSPMLFLISLGIGVLVVAVMVAGLPTVRRALRRPRP